MKVIIDISENDASFAMKVLKSLSFVKKAKPLSNSAEKVWEDLIDSSEEIRLHKEGKIQLKTAQELLNEL